MFYHVFRTTPVVKREIVKVDREESMRSAKRLNKKRGFKTCVLQTDVNLNEKKAYIHGVEIASYG